VETFAFSFDSAKLVPEDMFGADDADWAIYRKIVYIIFLSSEPFSQTGLRTTTRRHPMKKKS
jgi:hypothetical protein